MFSGAQAPATRFPKFSNPRYSKIEKDKNKMWIFLFYLQTYFLCNQKYSSFETKTDLLYKYGV